MREDVREMQDICTVEVAMTVLGGRWKLVILHHLLARTMRFGELRRALPGITQRMLTRQLRELEADGIVRRTVYGEVPPRVEYSVTAVGRSLEDIVVRLDRWGRWYRATRETPETGETGETPAG